MRIFGWWRAPKPEVELDLDERAYRAWLRAASPDIWWFLSLSPEEQEALATLGDQHRADTAVAIGAAVASPEGAAAAAQTIGQPGGGELERLKAAAVRAARAAAPTMGGITKRRQDAELGRQRAKNSGRSLMGMAPREV